MQRLQCRLKFCLALTTNTAASCLLTFRHLIGGIYIHFCNVLSGKIQALLETFAVEKTSFRSLGTNLRAVLRDTFQANQTFGSCSISRLICRALDTPREYE